MDINVEVRHAVDQLEKLLGDRGDGGAFDDSDDFVKLDPKLAV
jgi:hypothetical protein